MARGAFLFGVRYSLVNMIALVSAALTGCELPPIGVAQA